MALIKRVDVVTPLLKRGQAFVPRAVGIGDIVDLSAKAVDLKHRLALRTRQDAHCGVERTAGGRRSVIRAGCGRLQRHAPAAGLDWGCRPIARRIISPAMPPLLKASSSSGLRCTRSLKGSRTLRSRTMRPANDWITEISSQSRKSFTSAARDL